MRVRLSQDKFFQFIGFEPMYPLTEEDDELSQPISVAKS